MNPDLSRRIAAIVGARPVDPDDRDAIVDAAQVAESWEELPAEIRALLERLAGQPTTDELLSDGQ